jgi:hypothetical protein
LTLDYTFLRCTIIALFLFGFVLVTLDYTFALTQSSIVKSNKYSFVTEWGSKGTGEGQFLRPHDLEFDNDNKLLYAVDRDGNRIQVFDINGTFQFTFGQEGNADGQQSKSSEI